MAAPNRILSLNLGMQTVGLAEFKPTQAGGLVLINYKLTELLGDPTADATRLAQSKVAIQQMMGDLGIKSGKVNYAISGQNVFTRFVKLPPVDVDRIEQIIEFEAQQNVPFPINEVVWNYQLIGGQQAGRVEVVLVAVKAELLDEINGIMEDAGLQVGVVDVAPLALYNAFRYNYSDVGGSSLLIDIGARTTNLVFVEPQKVFSRSIPIGGGTITAAVAKDFELSFSEAEQRKRAGGFVSLGTAYAEPSDPELARVSKIVRNTMTRLHAEISRSISFYRSQQGGSPPEQAFLCGGSSGMPYMREFFSEKFRLPVEFFNPLRNVAVSRDLNADEVGKSAHAMGELVGLALRSTSECPMELDLVPASVARQRELASRRGYLVMAAACLVLALLGWWFYYFRAADVQAEALEALNPQVAQLKNFENQFQQVRREVNALEKTAEPLLQAVDKRDYWTRAIDELNARLPESYIWITQLEPALFAADGTVQPLTAATTAATPGPTPPPPPVRPGEPQPQQPVLGVRMRGLYLDNPKGANIVDEFLNNLAQSPLFDIDLQQRSAVNPVRATPNKTEWAYDYELRLKLRDPTGF